MHSLRFFFLFLVLLPLATSSLPPPSRPLSHFLNPPTFPVPSSPSPPPSKIPLSLLFIPSFQGSLLSHCISATCHPLFLSPQSASTTAHLYYHLLNSPLQPHPKTHAEYPTSACAPSPYSHTGHCLPLPITGPVHHLRSKFADWGLVVDTIPYDWRLSTAQLFHAGFINDLQRRATNKSAKTVFLAHGTACILTLRALARLEREWKQIHVRAVICAGAIWGGSAVVEDAMMNGEGILTAGNVHVESDAMMNVRQEGRLDFRMMEFELGLKKGRRMGLQDVEGVWDERVDYVAEREDRVKLARSLESLKELTDEVEIGDVGAEVFCVVGRKGEGKEGDGVVLWKESGGGCEGIGEVVEVEAAHFNLTELFKGVVQRILEEEGKA